MVWKRNSRSINFFWNWFTSLFLFRLLLWHESTCCCVQSDLSKGNGNIYFLSQNYLNNEMIKMVTSIYVIRIHSFQSLQLSQRALTDTAPGKLVNLLSNDVNRFDIISVLVNPLWCSPVMTIIAAYILWVEVRWAGMIGMAIVFLIVPIQSNYRCGWMPECCCPETHK